MWFGDKEIPVLGIFPGKSGDLDWEALGRRFLLGFYYTPFIQDTSLAELWGHEEGTGTKGQSQEVPRDLPGTGSTQTWEQLFETSFSFPPA